MAIIEKDEIHPAGGRCYTRTAQAGGTSAWVPVRCDEVGLDLRVTSGTASVEITACAPSNLANAVPTAHAMGTVSNGSSSGTVKGASFVRLKATGDAELSVRT